MHSDNTRGEVNGNVRERSFEPRGNSLRETNLALKEERRGSYRGNGRNNDRQYNDGKYHGQFFDRKVMEYKEKYEKQAHRREIKFVEHQPMFHFIENGIQILTPLKATFLIIHNDDAAEVVIVRDNKPVSGYEKTQMKMLKAKFGATVTEVR